MTPDEILRLLVIKCLYINTDGSLEWGYVEGTTIDEIDLELNAALFAYIESNDLMSEV